MPEYINAGCSKENRKIVVDPKWGYAIFNS